MDVEIPGHSVRTFSSAIQCLSKIGKDLYCDFDPIDGLTLRALNDAKSAFCAVELAPSFFERCTAPTSTNTTKANNSADSNAGRGRKRKSGSSSTQASSGTTQELRFSCRVPMRALAPVVRPRKGIVSLRIKSEGHSAGNNNNSSSNDSQGGSLQLAFEFRLEVSNNNNTHNQSYHHYNNNNENHNNHNHTSSTTFCKVIHRMGVAEVDNIAAVAPLEGCSELVAAPKVLLNWLEPIKRTAEGCLIFTKDSDMVVATSFNSTDTSGSINLAAATKHILKTETSIHLEDLLDYEFQDRRVLPSSQNNDNDDDDDIDTRGMPICPMPENVNEEVVLVFGMKEAKALLQFCCLNSSLGVGQMYGNQGWGDDHHRQDASSSPRAPWSVAVNFHWAGKPLVLESKAQGVSIQLVLATLSHSILKDLPMMQQRERSQQQQQHGRRESS